MSEVYIAGVDVRKKGEWQQSKAYKRVWHCSLCRRGYIIKNEKWWNYCPNCGAKMERRTDE